MAASHHGDTPYSGDTVTSVPVTPYTTSVDMNLRPAPPASFTHLAHQPAPPEPARLAPLLLPVSFPQLL